MAGERALVDRAMNEGKGILRLMPNWVPRAFCIPGKRLKLHPNDYYSFGAERGGIDERWFASTTHAENGPRTLPDEGLSYISVVEPRGTSGGERVLLRDAVELAGKEVLGVAVMELHGGWAAYSKFFDNQAPLPFHVHHTDAKAADIGQKGKPEAYFFPRQLNNHGGWFPYTFFGLNPETKKEDVRKALQRWDEGDNGILYLSKAHKLQPGTGWDVPPGVLHAPGTLLTYEPQRASDVSSMFQSLVWDSYTPKEQLIRDVPPAKKADLDYLISLLDWELNLDPEFHRNRFMQPMAVRPLEEMRAEGYEESWIVYKSDYFSAKELTVHAGRSVTITDLEAYGAIVIQGHGNVGPLEVESPTMIRFGEMTHDEIFVTVEAARSGVVVTNRSERDDLVLLKHFGPKS